MALARRSIQAPPRMDLRSGHFALPAVAMLTTFAAVVLVVLMVLVVLLVLVVLMVLMVLMALVPDYLLAPDYLLVLLDLLVLLVLLALLVLLVAEAVPQSPRSSAVAVSIFVGSGGSAGHLR